MKQIGVALLLVVLLAACSQQRSPENEELSVQVTSWQKLGGALDFTAAKDAISPKLFLDRNGSLVAAWKEYNNGPKVYMERWTSTGWQTLGKVFPLKYDYPDYSLVFDSSNSPVISTVVNSLGGVAVYRFDAVSQTWQQLGATFTGSSFLGSSNIAADKNGVIYSVHYDHLKVGLPDDPIELGKGKNIIRRWNGSSWQTVRTYQAVVVDFPRKFDVPINKLSFKSDGTTLVIDVNTDLFTTVLKAWNGTVWVDLCTTFRGAPASTILDRKDQCFGYDGDLDIYQGNQVLSNRVVSLFSATFGQANRPIAVSLSFNDVIVKRWSGSAWVQLGGIVDRVASREANFIDLIVDSSNTLYAAWAECVDYDVINTRCNNRNIYVSKYALN